MRKSYIKSGCVRIRSFNSKNLKKMMVRYIMNIVYFQERKLSPEYKSTSLWCYTQYIIRRLVGMVAAKLLC